MIQRITLKFDHHLYIIKYNVALNFPERLVFFFFKVILLCKLHALASKFSVIPLWAIGLNY